MADMTIEQLAPWLVVAFILAGLSATSIIGAINGRRRRKREEEMEARELATIVEEVRITPGGVICFILLVITVIATAFSYISAATVFQQIASGVSLIAGCILWGLGVALGQRRTYRIYRSEKREPY